MRLLAAGVIVSLVTGGQTPSGQSFGTRASPANPPASSAETRAPRHVALLIAISRYKNFPATGGEPGRSQLVAPVANDLPRMQRSLERWGFTAGDDMRVLTDAGASKAGIEAGFRWLAERATDTSDVVVVYYSGHGSWAPDEDGDERRLDPGDRSDEALVPWDARDIHDPHQLVIDDQLRVWLGAIGTKNVTVIVDACFSGTITRGIGAGRARGPTGPPTGSAKRVALDEIIPGHTLITAATAGQTASEIPFSTSLGDRDFGVLTYFLTRAMDAADSVTRYEDLIGHVRTDLLGLSGRIPQQDPQLEGDRGALVFRVRRPVAPRAMATVVAVSPRVTLNVGAVNGVRVGAVYDIYRADEARFDDAAERTQVEVDSVGETQSFAKTMVAVNAGAATLVPGARALLALVPAGAKTISRLRVRLETDAAAVRDAVNSVPFVRVVDSPAAAMVRAAGGMARVTVNGRNLPPDSGNSIAVIGSDTAYAATPRGLCPPLRRALGILALDAVDNPSAPYIPVQMRLVKSGAVPQPTAAPALDTVVVGQTYTLFARVSAPSVSTLYLTVAVAGYAGRTAVVYPDTAGNNTPIPLNRWEPIVSGLRVDPPTGLEVLKAVVSSRPFDLHGLVEALPNCSDQGSRGNASRAWQPRTEPVTGWATAERTVMVVGAPARPK